MQRSLYGMGVATAGRGSHMGSFCQSSFRAGSRQWHVAIGVFQELPHSGLLVLGKSCMVTAVNDALANSTSRHILHEQMH